MLFSSKKKKNCAKTPSASAVFANNEKHQFIIVVCCNCEIKPITSIQICYNISLQVNKIQLATTLKCKKPYKYDGNKFNN